MFAPLTINFLLLLCFISLSKSERIPPRYTYCAKNYYGPLCNNKCNCQDSKHLECDEGPYGSGKCLCIFGKLCNKKKNEKKISDRVSLASLNYSNEIFNFVQIDPIHTRHSRQTNATITHLHPLPFINPHQFRIIDIDANVASKIFEDYDPTILDMDALKNEIIGEVTIDATKSFCHNYGGHQFGNWAGQLGDGRALSLGEVIGVDISTKTTYELSIKGGGRTPYSRSGDGRAVFQSVAREYLGGIALNSIKIPTVTSLALIGTILDNTDDGIFRDEYYDNKNKMVPPGIILRVSPSFLRLGSLQIAYEKQGINGVVDIARYALKKISELEKRNIVEYDNVDDALQYISSEDKSTCFFQQRRSSSSSSSCANDYKSMENNEVLTCLLRKFSKRLASLIAAWNANGFVHGVMNTDNISLIGLTIDLNVFGWLQNFNVNWSSNHIDEENRYKYGAQYKIGRWNLERLIDIINLKGNVERPGGEKSYSNTYDNNENIILYQKIYKRCYAQQMAIRLGLNSMQSMMGEQDIFIKLWRRWLKFGKADYTRASRLLAEVDIFKFNIIDDDDVKKDILNKFTTVTGASAIGKRDLKSFLEFLHKHLINHPEILNKWRTRVRRQNPRYVLRTGPVRRIIQDMVQNKNDIDYLNVINILKKPYDVNTWSIDDELQRMTLKQKNKKDPEKMTTIRRDLSSLEMVEDVGLKISCGGQ